MKKIIVSLIFLFLTFSFIWALPQGSIKAEESKESVIFLVTYDEEDAKISSGTGFIIKDDILVTNYHLVCAAEDVEGIDHTGDSVKIKGLIYAEKDFNIAVLRIRSRAEPIKMGNSEELRKGDIVYALGGEQTGTIVMSDGRVENIAQYSENYNVIDTSLPMQSTFSGAPIVNNEGELVAIIINPELRADFAITSNILDKIPTEGDSTKFKKLEAEDYLDTKKAAFFMGKSLAILDKRAKAPKFLRTVINKDPDNKEAHLLLSSIYVSQRDYRAASSSYKKVIELDPNNYKAHYELGMVLVKMRNFEEALEYLRDVTRLDPDNKEVYNLIGTSHQELEQYDQAINAFNKYLESEPESPKDTYLRLATCYLEVNNPEGAVEAYKGVLEENPDDIRINYKLADAYREAKLYDEAAEVYKKLAQLSPEDADNYYSMILKMYDMAGQTEKGIEAAKLLIENNPQNEKGPYNLGFLYMKINEYDKAAEAFKQAIAIKPDFKSAYSNLGVCYNKQKKYGSAVKIYEKIVDMDPNDDEAWFNLGINYMRMKDFFAAEEPLKTAAKLNPNNAYVLYNLTIVYLNLNDRKNASYTFKKLLEMNPNLAEKLRKYFK